MFGYFVRMRIDYCRYSQKESFVSWRLYRVLTLEGSAPLLLGCREIGRGVLLMCFICLICFYLFPNSPAGVLGYVVAQLLGGTKYSEDWVPRLMISLSIWWLFFLPVWCNVLGGHTEYFGLYVLLVDVRWDNHNNIPLALSFFIFFSFCSSQRPWQR